MFNACPTNTLIQELERDDDMRPCLISAAVLALISAGAGAATPEQTPANPPRTVAAPVSATALYIVQAASLDAASRSVRSVGADVHQKLDIIRAVSAHLTPAQAARLRADAHVRLFQDRELRTSGSLFDFLKKTTNTLNSTLANNALVKPVSTSVLAPVVGTVTTNQIVSTITSSATNVARPYRCVFPLSNE